MDMCAYLDEINPQSIEFAHRADPKRVDSLINYLSGGNEVPPILVVRMQEGYRLLDGHHRVVAARRMGLAKIAAYIVENEDVENLIAEVDAWDGSYPSLLGDFDKYIILPDGRRYSEYRE